MPTEHNPKTCGCKYLGNDAWTCGHLDNELFTPDEAPFNLSGEPLDNSTTEEGEARVRALAESEARKAQQAFPSILESAEQERREKRREEGVDWICTGNFDGFTCGSDADPGL